MTISFANNNLTVFLEGRIDTNNSPQIEKEIFDAIGQNKDKELTLDAEKLEYISSAGLRVLLKIQKSSDKPIPIINVSRDVYDIFETTGFTELLDVKKAYRKVDVSGMRLIGQGATGSVYRADDETVIKVFNKDVNFDMIINAENDKARKAFLSGVPTAIPYDIVKVGDCFGTVYEMLNAKDLVSVITEDKAHLEDYIKLFAKTVREMHSIKVDTGKFVPAKTSSLRSLHLLASVLDEEEMRKVREIYENVPDRDTFTHGDCHIGNVMLKDGELMFIDLVAAGAGHPIFDMVSMYSLFVERANDKAAIAQSPILRNFTTEEINRIWNIFIRAYLDTDDEALIKKAEYQIRGISAVRRLFAVIFVPGLISPEALRAMKQQISEYYDNGLEPICF
ncbi:MAG: anti-sigma factor antagonist [Ruminiclostridium sp.]|nr:anti-sigma factor antagonist [Ruminiclostridium sp.]